MLVGEQGSGSIYLYFPCMLYHVSFSRYICENTQEEKAKGIANSPCSANL